MKKFLCASLTMLVVLGLMGACGVAQEQEKVTLVIATGWAGAELEPFLPVLEAFEEQYPWIEVTHITLRPEDLGLILPGQFAAGLTPADVIAMPWLWFIKEKGEAGHLHCLAHLIDPADYLPGTVEFVTVDDKVFGAPYSGKVKPGFWYRKSFFEEHGLTEPASWEEFVALLEEIAQIPGIDAPIASGNGVGWPLSDVTEHFLTTFGGVELHEALIAGEVDWTDPVVYNIFADKLVPLIEAGHFGEPTEWTLALELWWEGYYALYYMGSWITVMVEDPADLGVFALPEMEAIVFAFEYWMVPVYTAHPEEAMKLARFLTTRGQLLHVKEGGMLATYIHVPLEAYPPVDRVVAELLIDVEAIVDLDDYIGGAFQLAFWDQLKLLWVAPEMLPEVLEILEETAP